jgi:hypothetical protein
MSPSTRLDEGWSKGLIRPRRVLRCGVPTHMGGWANPTLPYDRADTYEYDVAWELESSRHWADPLHNCTRKDGVGNDQYKV